MQSVSGLRRHQSPSIGHTVTIPVFRIFADQPKRSTVTTPAFRGFAGSDIVIQLQFQLSEDSRYFDSTVYLHTQSSFSIDPTMQKALYAALTAEFDIYT